MTVNAQEIENFTKDSSHWWDADGPFGALHKLNPVRLRYIKTRICTHFGREFEEREALKGLSVLDIGCGGGLICEPMARMGAKVTGIDADPQAIEIAEKHARQSDLKIDYRNESTAEIGRKTFDVVLALEIVEHVADLDQFMDEASALLNPGGLMIVSTLNRTPSSFALGIVAAEYILRWVPQGTHHWKKFVKPSEMARLMRSNGLQPVHIEGLRYRSLKDDFVLSPHTKVNYFLSAIKSL